MELPPNRFRTRSVAIVAGYSPERLYSNMPPGAFVVESGVYKVGADREWERPEPIYWKQVVFGARNGSDGSGSMPRRRVGRLVQNYIYLTVVHYFIYSKSKVSVTSVVEFCIRESTGNRF